MDGHRQRNAHPQLQIGAGGDEGRDAFGKVVQADAQRQQQRGALQIVRLQRLLQQVLRMLVRQQAIQREVAQQAEHEHAVTQHRRHAGGMQRRRQHFHQ